MTVEQITLEGQAIINHIAQQRNAALDQIAQLVGQVALGNAKIKELEARIVELTPLPPDEPTQ